MPKDTDTPRYFPSAGGDWETTDAASAGFDAGRLAEAVAFAEGHESPWPRDLGDRGETPGLTEIEPEPWNAILGPLKNRGGPAGVIMRGGRLAAHWGDPGRVDLTFSIAKSYLAVITGLALADGLIGSIDDPVSKVLSIPEFASDHNAKVTWRHLLTQTSEWQGTLFDKPDQVDHFRQVGAGSDNSKKGQLRELQEPGSYWEYNDVRVNVLSLALLHLYRRPLADVVKDRIMDPIGATDTWEWHAYSNAMVDIDGQSMPSVPGGTHWGGGLWINTWDHARFGHLLLNNGTWGGQQLVPADWVKALATPSDVAPFYGLLWWLNNGPVEYQAAPATSYFALGAGSSIIWIEPSLDMVVVARWIDQAHINGLLGAVMAAVD